MNFLFHDLTRWRYEDLKYLVSHTLRKKCPYSELLWSAFSRIRAEYREILRISVQIWENADQNNSEYFSHNDTQQKNVLRMGCLFIWAFISSASQIMTGKIYWRNIGANTPFQ